MFSCAVLILGIGSVQTDGQEGFMEAYSPSYANTHPFTHMHARTHDRNNAGRVPQELTLQIYIMKHHSIVLVKATRHLTTQNFVNLSRIDNLLNSHPSKLHIQ